MIQIMIISTFSINIPKIRMWQNTVQGAQKTISGMFVELVQWYGEVMRLFNMVRFKRTTTCRHRVMTSIAWHIVVATVLQWNANKVTRRNLSNWINKYYII